MWSGFGFAGVSAEPTAGASAGAQAKPQRLVRVERVGVAADGAVAGPRAPGEQHPFQGAKLMRIDRSTESATRLVDLIVALDRTDALAIGDFVEVVFAAETNTWYRSRHVISR